MTTFAYSVDIARPLTDVYALARQVERQPEFMPEYLSCRVVDQQNDRMLLERTAKIHGKIMAWQAWVRFQENEGVYFTHHGGRLDGMKVHWLFHSLDKDQTRMTMTQTLNVQHPIPGVPFMLERWIFGPKLRDIALRVIKSFKKTCEISETETIHQP
jgi:ribosome-associated toxin RatA of RatAB toxin-antitoxin module